MNEELEQVQATIEQLEAKVKLAEKMAKLVGNKEFNELITEGYLGNDIVRLTLNLKPKAEDNEIVNTMLTAKSIFSRYVAEIMSEGDEAYRSLEEHKRLQDEIESGE